MASKTVSYKEIKSSETCKYDGLSLGEVMLRLHPDDVPTARAHVLRVFQGGGETNVACGLAYTFGLRAGVLTALVDDDAGQSLLNQFHTAAVDTRHVILFNTSNDGSRFSTDAKGSLMNGINFTYNGRGVLPSSSCYYRAHTPARELRAGDFDWASLFGADGVRVFNTGGVFTQISPSACELACEAVEAAAAHGTFVAADLNYRSKVQPDKDVARQANRKIIPHLGFLVGNDTDMADALGYETDVPEGADFNAWLEAYKGTVRQIAADYPNLGLIGTQWRGATNADLIDWGAALYDSASDTFYTAPLRLNVPIIDRTGGGDSFTSGVIAAILKGHDLQTAVEWGAAHGILVQEVPGDITMVDERAVVSECKRARSGGGVKAVR
jgi:2-dehydro-3-deoxygluconokinase